MHAAPQRRRVWVARQWIVQRGDQLASPESAHRMAADVGSASGAGAGAGAGTVTGAGAGTGAPHFASEALAAASEPSLRCDDSATDGTTTTSESSVVGFRVMKPVLTGRTDYDVIGAAAASARACGNGTQVAMAHLDALECVARAATAAAYDRHERVPGNGYAPRIAPTFVAVEDVASVGWCDRLVDPREDDSGSEPQVELVAKVTADSTLRVFTIDPDAEVVTFAPGAWGQGAERHNEVVRLLTEEVGAVLQRARAAGETVLDTMFGAAMGADVGGTIDGKLTTLEVPSLASTDDKDTVNQTVKELQRDANTMPEDKQPPLRATIDAFARIATRCVAVGLGCPTPDIVDGGEGCLYVYFPEDAVAALARRWRIAMNGITVQGSFVQLGDGSAFDATAAVGVELVVAAFMTCMREGAPVADSGTGSC